MYDIANCLHDQVFGGKIVFGFGKIKFRTYTFYFGLLILTSTKIFICSFLNALFKKNMWIYLQALHTIQAFNYMLCLWWVAKFIHQKRFGTPRKHLFRFTHHFYYINIRAYSLFSANFTTRSVRFCCAN